MLDWMGGLEVEADEVCTVRDSVRIGDAMQMERRPALMGPKCHAITPPREQLERLEQQQQPLR